MAGNVLEWTRSFFEAYPGNEKENRYFGQMYRVLRGGAWYFKKNSSESTMRFIMRPNLRWNYVGFRCAKDLS
jgi:formylglycine-generating enzyme required for sulfatase activity